MPSPTIEDRAASVLYLQAKVNEIYLTAENIALVIDPRVSLLEKKAYSVVENCCALLGEEL